MRRLKELELRLSEFWVQHFWQHPNRLSGLKVTMAVAFLMIPLILLGFPQTGGTLALGVLGGAIAETDDHPRGRIKSLILTLIGFLIATIAVELLHPYPLAFAAGLFISSFIFIMIGGISERYRGITFGTLLVSTYAMLGLGLGTAWYIQPLLLAAGAMLYGGVSLLLLIRKPWRPLQEQLSISFKHLGHYVGIKAKLFPSEEEKQELIRNQLAQKNIELVQSIKRSHQVLRTYASEIGKKDENLERYYSQWLLLQRLHERAASSHESYSVLSSETDNIRIIEGMGQALNELSQAILEYANSLLNNKAYKQPISLTWTLSAISEIIEQHQDSKQYGALSLLLKNLKEMEQILQRLTEPLVGHGVPSDYEPLSIKQRIKKLFDRQNPRFKYALRLSISLLIGYGLIYFFKLEKGEWILLTSLLVLQQSFIGTRQRFFERVLGTIYGIVLGLLLIQLFPTLASNLLLLFISYYLFFYFAKSKYAIAVTFVTIAVITLFNIQFNQGIEVMLPRIIHTIIGASLAYLSVRLILPDWQYQNLPQLLSNALSKNKTYFEAIYADDSDKEQYDILRQKAHEADAALTAAWQSIKVESRQAKKLQDQAFKLTYLNHSLLSYISAFGAHNRENKIFEEYMPICKEISYTLNKANECLLKKDIESDKLREYLSDKEEQAAESINTRTMSLLINIKNISKELANEVIAVR